MMRAISSWDSSWRRSTYDGLGQPFGVRVVGAEHHPVGADEPDDVHRVVLVERVHPDVPLERRHRVLGEEVRVHLVDVGERLEERPDPAGPVLDRARTRSEGNRSKRPWQMAEAIASMIPRW